MTVTSSRRVTTLAAVASLAVSSACTDDNSKREALALENARCAAVYAELVEDARRKNSENRQSYEAGLKGHWMAGVILVGDRFPAEHEAAAKTLRTSVGALPSVEECGSVIARSMRLASEMVKASSKP